MQEMHPNQGYPHQYNSYQQNVPIGQGVQQSASTYPQGNYTQYVANPTQYAAPHSSTMPNPRLQYQMPTSAPHSSAMPNPRLQYQMPNSSSAGMASTWNPTASSSIASSWDPSTESKVSSWNPVAASMSSSGNPTDFSSKASSWNPTATSMDSFWNPSATSMSSSWNPTATSMGSSWNPTVTSMGSSWNTKQQTSMYLPSLVPNQPGSSPVPTRSPYDQGQQIGKRPASSDMFSQQPSKKAKTDTGQSIPYTVEVNGYQEGIHIHGNCYVTLTNNNGQAKPSSSMDGHLNVSVRPAVNTSVMNPMDIEKLRSPNKLHKIGIIMKTLMSVSRKYLPPESFAKIVTFLKNRGCLAKVLPESLCRHLLKYEKSVYVCNCIQFYRKYREGMCLLIGRGNCTNCTGTEKLNSILDETANVLAMVNTVKKAEVVSSKLADYRDQSVLVSKSTGVGQQQTLPNISSFCSGKSSSVNAVTPSYQANSYHSTASAVHRQQPTNSANKSSVGENESALSRQFSQFPSLNRTDQNRSESMDMQQGTYNRTAQQVPQNLISQLMMAPQIPGNFSTSSMRNHASYSQQASNFTTPTTYPGPGGMETHTLPIRYGQSWNQTNANNAPVNCSQLPNTGYSTYVPYPSSNSQIGSPPADANLQRWNAVQDDYVQRDHWQEDKTDKIGPASGGLAIGKWHVPETESKAKVPKADEPTQQAAVCPGTEKDKRDTNTLVEQQGSELHVSATPVQVQASETLPFDKSLWNFSQSLPFQHSTKPINGQTEQCLSLKLQETNESQNNSFENLPSTVFGASRQLTADFSTAKAELSTILSQSRPQAASVNETNLDNKQAVLAQPTCISSQNEAGSLVTAGVKPPQPQKDHNVVIILDSDDESEIADCADPTNPEVLSGQGILTHQIDASSTSANKTQQRIEATMHTSQQTRVEVMDSPQSTEDQFWSHLIKDTTDDMDSYNRTTVQSPVNSGNNARSSAGSTQTSIGNHADSSAGSTQPSIGNTDHSSAGSTQPSIGNNADSSAGSTQPSIGNHADSSAGSTQPSIGNTDHSSAGSTQPSIGNNADSSAGSTQPSIGNHADSSAGSTQPSIGNHADSSAGSTQPSIGDTDHSSAGSVQPSTGGGGDDGVSIIDKEIASEDSTAAAEEPALNFNTLFSDGSATFATFTLDESDDEIEMTTVEIGREDWEKMTTS